MYKILEARLEYKDGYLSRVTVLVEISQGDIRAIYSTTKPVGGYHYLSRGETVTEQLLQNVAGYGMETVDRDRIFPNWKKNALVK